MKTVVTGGAGFIGSALVQTLLQDNHGEAIVYDKLTYAGRLENLAPVKDHPGFRFVRGDILDGGHFRELLDEVRPDVVFHLAAESHVDRSLEDEGAFIRTNVEGTARLLNACHDYLATLPSDARRAFRFIHVSTDEVFGALGENGAFDEDSPYRPNSPYAASKASSDMIARSYFQTFRFPVVITNCSNNYGPRQFPEKLIPLCLMRALTGEPLPVYGQGQQVRDWLHVDDHVDALVAVAKRAEPGARYCIGGGTELKNIDTIKTLCRLLDRLVPRAAGLHHELITFVEDRLGHDFRYAIDSRRIAKDIGWRPKLSFERGLEQTVQWYLSNDDWVRSLVTADVTKRRGLLRQAAAGEIAK